MTSTITLLICSECGVGNYFECDRPGCLHCEECAHEVTTADLVLDDDETWMVDGTDRLTVVTIV